jgi:hypothetical protein
MMRPTVPSIVDFYKSGTVDIDLVKQSIAAINSISAGSDPTSGYAKAVLLGQFRSAVQHDLLNVRSTLVFDLLSSSDAEHKHVANLLYQHTFSDDKLGNVWVDVRKSLTSGTSPSVHYIRSCACADLVEYAGKCKAILDAESGPSTKRNLLASLYIQTFGTKAFADRIDDKLPTVDECLFKKTLEELHRSQFADGSPSSDARGTERAPIGRVARKVARGASDNEVAFQQYMQQIHESLEKLLTSMRHKVNTIHFDAGGHQGDNDAWEGIEAMAVKVIERRIPIYFDVSKNVEGRLTTGRVAAEMLKAAAPGSDDDATVTFIYVLKFLRFLTQIGTLWVTVRIFREVYVRYVYARRLDPPPLTRMLMLFVGLDLSAQVFITTILTLLAAPGSAGSQTIGDEFMFKYLADALLCTLAYTTLGSMLAAIMWRKTYFRYKYDGVGTIKAFADMQLAICGTTLVIPFFMLA